MPARAGPAARGRSAFEVDDVPLDGGDPLAPLVRVGVREVVGHGAAGEAAGRGSVEAVIDAWRHNVAPVDGPLEGHLRLGVKRTETRPAELDAGKAADDEGRRSHRPPEGRVAPYSCIGPQRVDVADAAGELGDCDPRSDVVVHRVIDPEPGSGLGPHRREHLLVELRLRHYRLTLSSHRPGPSPGHGAGTSAPCRSWWWAGTGQSADTRGVSAARSGAPRAGTGSARPGSAPRRGAR